jgi:hypothetical protein
MTSTEYIHMMMKKEEGKQYENPFPFSHKPNICIIKFSKYV